MFVRVLKSFAVAAAVIWLTGCATNANFRKELDTSFWETKNQTIAVAVAEMPVADCRMTGSMGLLDIAIARGNAGTLIDHLKTINFKDYQKVVPELAVALNTQGFKTTQVAEGLSVATLPEFKGPSIEGKAFTERDFRSFREKTGASRLLLITLTSAGTVRDYYGPIPTSVPVVFSTATGEMIDLTTNEITWRHIFEQKMPIEEPWDQEPSFPNVTRALEKSILTSRKAVVAAFDLESVKQAVAAKQQAAK